MNMQLSEFTFKIILLFLPGFIALIIIRQLIYYKVDNFIHSILHSFTLGFASYAAYYVALSMTNCIFSTQYQFYFWNTCINGSQPNPTEIIFVSITSIIVGFITAKIINSKLITKIGHFFNITKQFSEPDVWSYIFNSESDVLWITIRDKKKKLAYQGYVTAFSDTYLENEIFLTQVKVYDNETGEHFYDIQGLYISRDPKDITIEFCGNLSN